MKTIHQTWEGCYDRQWGDYITSSSFAHPAKMARGLLERIIQHGFERGWFHRGDTIADCFGGVGTTGIIGAYHGLKVFSVELEKKFVSLARRNYALHASKWKTLGCPRPVILQGDSRQFDKLVGEAVGVVSSPPYAGAGEVLGSNNGIDFTKAKEVGKRRTEARAAAGQQYGRTEGQIASLPCGSVAACVSSPTYSDQELSGTRRALEEYDRSGHHAARDYGKETGQIGRLAPGDIAAVLSSPPWEDNSEGSRKAHKMGGRDKILACRRGHGASDDAVLAQATRDEQKVYGDSPGQIGRLKGRSVQGVVSSPPFQRSMSDNPSRQILGGSGGRMGQSCKGDNYGDSPGQIGREKQETYWLACKQVYASVYRTIKPNGVLVLVTKDFVRKGKRVPLSDDTVTLCESLGFVLIERIRAMLVSQTTHGDLFNGSDVKTKSRKSFFRRLHEARPGAVKIDWEDVLVFRKP